MNRGGVFETPIYSFYCIRAEKKCANFTAKIGETVGRKPEGLNMPRLIFPRLGDEQAGGLFSQDAAEQAGGLFSYYNGKTKSFK